MPASTSQAADGRVRSPDFSLEEKLEHMHFNEAPARCRSPCCRAPSLLPPLTADRSPSASSSQRPRRERSPSSSSTTLRPALNRNAASHHSGKSAYSTGTDGSSHVQSEDGFAEFGDMVDTATFEQILEMDDDEDDRDFSKSIVYDFFDQAEGTFDKMDRNLDERNLSEISALGHFLKGSSATLGLTKVKNSCEKIQHFGAGLDETGSTKESDEQVSLDNAKRTIKEAKDQFQEVKVVLKRFYRDQSS